MMEQVKSKIKLPTMAYVISIISDKEYKFNVSPLSSECAEIIDKLQELGADVNLSPEQNPTRVSIVYRSNTCGSAKVLGHTVVGANLELTLNLLDNNNSCHERRLKSFLECLYEVEKGVIPAGASGVEWVQVINNYQF